MSTAPRAPPKPPPRPQAEALAENLKKMLSDQGFLVTAHCPEVAKDAVKLTCNVVMDGGAPFDLELAKDAGDRARHRARRAIARSLSFLHSEVT